MFTEAMGSHRLRWSAVACLAPGVLVASLALACSPSDEASPQPTPTSPTLPTPPDPTVYVRVQLSGRVLNQNGAPVSGALVEVDYASAGGGFSNPPSHCPGFGFCWLVTRQSGSVFSRVRTTTIMDGTHMRRGPTSCGGGYTWSPFMMAMKSTFSGCRPAPRLRSRTFGSVPRAAAPPLAPRPSSRSIQ